MRFIRPGWDKIARMCEALAKKVRAYRPDVLVGISRGGLVPVRLLSDILGNRNVAIMKIEFYKGIGKTSKSPKITQPLTAPLKGKKVLIVDDVADSGRSLMVAAAYVRKLGAKQCKIATLHFKPASAFRPDFFLERTSAWIIYPWELHEVERELRGNRGKKKKNWKG
jgi:hypoxanthine phosphoribosyltransferase